MRRAGMNVAEAKAHFSEVINRVASGDEEVVVTKRGRIVAVICRPTDRARKGLGLVHGWLDEKDPFFRTMEEIVEDRHARRLRITRRRRA